MSEPTTEQPTVNAEDAKVLDFVEVSVTRVSKLEKQAAAAEKRAEAAEKALEDLRVEHSDEVKQIKQATARVSFDRERLEQLGLILNTAGITKFSSAAIADRVESQPDLLVEMFQQFVSSDDSAGELTERKSASDRTDPNTLWQHAAS